MESYTLEEKVLRKVMRNIPMGLIVSKEGFRRKIYYVNDTACEIMGYTREEYIKKMHRFRRSANSPPAPRECAARLQLFWD